MKIAECVVAFVLLGVSFLSTPDGLGWWQAFCAGEAAVVSWAVLAGMIVAGVFIVNVASEGFWSGLGSTIAQLLGALVVMAVICSMFGEKEKAKKAAVPVPNKKS